MIAKATKLTAFAVGSIICASSFAAAAPVTPVFQTFGDLAGAEFGGDGIPNDAVAISTFTAQNGDMLTLGLTATGRFANPPVGNDGAGTFTADPGANDDAERACIPNSQTACESRLVASAASTASKTATHPDTKEGNSVRSAS